MSSSYSITHGQIKRLTRHNTPTIANSMGVLSQRKKTTGFNLEPTTDFMPEMGAMCGYAVTVKYQASQEKVEHAVDYLDYFKWMASLPAPKIVVIQDLDAPDGIVGSFWGECNGNRHRAFGCVGTITDGAIRDLHEMKNAGFKALARRLCVAPAYGKVIDYNCPVTVFGLQIKPGELIHADHHGFITIPPDVAPLLDEVSNQYDLAELEHIITPCRRPGITLEEVIAEEHAFQQRIQKLRSKIESVRSGKNEGMQIV
ncbi:RraA family protein [candidate division KSB1 bacterium]|nr:RraA family protein [candidate division KSB1 bacterium]